MTMDLYGHLVDQNLWDAATKIGAASGDTTGHEPGQRRWFRQVQHRWQGADLGLHAQRR
jgi:hypothetical protein